MKLTVAGWIFMLSAWSAIAATTLWCLVRLLSQDGRHHRP